MFPPWQWLCSEWCSRNTWQKEIYYDKESCLCYTLRSCRQEISILFTIFSPRLEDNDTFKWNSNNYLYLSLIWGFTENFENYISMYCYSPIAGSRSWKVGKLMKKICSNFLTFQDPLPAMPRVCIISKVPMVIVALPADVGFPVLVNSAGTLTRVGTVLDGVRQVKLVVIWHMTCDIWQVTCDIWQVTCDIS